MPSRAAAAALSLFASSALAVPTVDWQTPTTGTLDGVAVSLSRIGVPLLETVELRAGDYAAFPSNNCEDRVVTYDARFDWTATFGRPVDDLLIYLHAWRGTAAGPDNVTYNFGEPITIVSGLDGASVILSQVLIVPNTGFHSGIVRVAGPVGSLDMTTNATTNSAQGMTFGKAPPLVPPPAITQQPESQVVDSPGVAVFTLFADNAATYQWRLDGVPLADGPGVSGAATDRLTLAASLDAVGTYDCVLTGPGGTATTDPAVLAVRPVCFADINEDGLLDLSDITVFVSLFQSGCP